jgi:ADP-ribosylglycohydrolase
MDFHFNCLSCISYDTICLTSACKAILVEAYFFNDTTLLKEEALLAAVVTHSYPKAIAMAIAVAFAACFCETAGIQPLQLRAA